MVDIALTLDYAAGVGQPYSSNFMQMAQATAGDGPNGWVDGTFVKYPLSNPPLVLGTNGFAAPQRLQTYAVIDPAGVKSYITMPNTASANISDLLPVPLPPIDPSTIIDTAVANALNNGTLSKAALDAATVNKVDRTPTGHEQLATQDYLKFKPLFDAIDARNTAKVDIGFMGPSTIAGYLTTWASQIPQAFARRLRHRFPVAGNSPYQGGTGAIPVPDGPIRGVGATASPASTPWTFSASMLFDETGFSSGLNHTIAYTNGAEYGQLTTDRDLTHFKITHVKGTAGGAAAAYVQAGSNTAVTFSTAAGATSVGDDQFTALQLGFASGVIPAGTVIKVGGMSTGAYLILSHVEGFYNDTTKGFHVHQIGHSGYDTTDWLQAVPGATTRATIANLNLKFLFLDFFAINAGSTGRTYPNGGSRSAAQWKAEAIAFIAWLRAGGVTCNFGLISSYDPTGGIALVDSWQSYVTAMREIATADATVAFYDHSLRMPATAGGSDYYAADKVHLTDRGNEIVTRGILDYVLDLKDEGILGEALPGKADLVGGKVPLSELPDLSVTSRTVLATAQTATAIPIPSAAKVAYVYGRGAGGGGGSGRKGLTSTARRGGGGGGTGGLIDLRLDCDALRTAGVTILYGWVGAGGNGGAAQATASSNGIAGAGGSDITFITTSSSSTLATAQDKGLGVALGGGGGGGGTTTAASSGIAGSGSQGGGQAASTPYSILGAGGPGGDSTASNNQSDGSLSYSTWFGNSLLQNTFKFAAAGGTVPGGNGQAGSVPAGVATAGQNITPSGGGGGAGTNTGNGGTGGDGYRGGGGGGGGAGTDTQGNSGAGGKGGDGFLVITFS